MPVKYRVVKARNPKTGVEGHVVRLLRHYVVDGRMLARRIADGTTVSEEDAGAVLMRLSKLMAEELLRGNTIRLEGIGLFGLTVRSGIIPEGTVNPTTFIKGRRIKFRADRGLRVQLPTVEFKLDGDERATA